MRFNGSRDYAVPVDAVIAMLQDEKNTIDKYESMGHREVAILEFVSNDEMLRIVSSRVVDVELPGFAKKALKPTNTMVQTDEWHGHDDEWSGSFNVEVKGAPVRIAGTMSLTPAAGGSRHDVSIELQVKVPVIGNKIAAWVGTSEVQRTLDAEFAFNDARLAAQ